MVRCPTCATEVQADWDWCHACGWDPEGLRPDAVAPPLGGAHRPPPTRGRAGRPRGVFAVRGRSSLTSRYRVRRPSMLGTLGALLLFLGGGYAARRVVILGLGLVVGLLGTPAEQPQFATFDGPIEADDPPPPAGARGGGDAVLSAGGGAGGALTDADGIPVDQSWPRFTAADGTFSVEFPVDPTVQQLPGVPPQITGVEFTKATFASSEYAVTVYELAPAFSLGEPSEFLASFTARQFDSNGMTLLSSAPGTYAYSTSIDFTTTVDATGVMIHGVMFITEGRLYTLMVGGPPGATLDPERFLDSLTLG